MRYINPELSDVDYNGQLVKPIDRLVSELNDKLDNFYSVVQTQGYFALWSTDELGDCRTVIETNDHSYLYDYLLNKAK